MTTRTELKETYEENIKDLINDYFEFHNYEKKSTIFEDIESDLMDRVFEMIDGLEEIIYTYQAKQVSEIIGMYGAFDTSDLTGERFDNWSQVAFENVYQFIYENINFEEIFNQVITE